MGQPASSKWIVPPPRRLLGLGKRPTFSVVIPTYQAAGTVGAAAASALAQTWPASEIIVVDDGSTDDLDAALAPFRDRIVLIRKRNGGGASALNAGVAEATGEFVALLDSDDEWSPHRLEALAELSLHRPDLDLITTETEIVVDGDVVGRFHETTPFVTSDQRGEILRRCFTGGWPAARTARIRAIGGFDESLPIGYDWDFSIRAILDGALAGFVDQPHLRYTARRGSVSADRRAALWARVRLLEKTVDNPALTSPERRVLERSLRDHRTRAVFSEAECRMQRGRTEWRWLIAHAAARGIAPRARAVLAMAAVAPRTAQRYMPHDPGALPERFAPRTEEL